MKRKPIWTLTTTLWHSFHTDRRTRTDLPLHILWLLYRPAIHHQLTLAARHHRSSRYLPLVLSGTLTTFPDRHHQRTLRRFNRIMFATILLLMIVLWLTGKPL